MSEPRILPDDADREQYPLFDGLLAYFPAALCEVARWSIVGNNKHNPGESLHWCREKSHDHENKIIRHLLDARQLDKDGFVEAVALAWRALALLQTILEERGWAEGKNAKWAADKEEKNAEPGGGVSVLCGNRQGDRWSRQDAAWLEALSACNAAASGYDTGRDVAGVSGKSSKITDLAPSSTVRLGK